MLSAKQLRERLKAYLDNRESLDELEDWLAIEVASIQKDSDPEAVRFLAMVIHSVDLHSDGYLDDLTFNREIASFVSPQVAEWHIRFIVAVRPVATSIKPEIKRFESAAVDQGSVVLA